MERPETQLEVYSTDELRLMTVGNAAMSPLDSPIERAHRIKTEAGYRITVAKDPDEVILCEAVISEVDNFLGIDNG